MTCAADGRYALGMGGLEIFVKTITLLDKSLLPLAEAVLLNLDLLSELLPEQLLLFLELGVVELAGTSLAKLAGLHLLCTVGLVVCLFRCVDQVKHVRADENRAELLEIAVVLILHLGDTPRVLAALDNAAIASLDVLLGANNREGHGSHELLSVAGSIVVVLLNWGLIDGDALGLNDSTNLLLKLGKVGRAQSVSLGNNGNQVDSGAKSPHDLNVERLESVPGGTDEVEAGVDTQINLVLSPGLLLL